ncbi:MAG: hypothetical protein HC853_16390 [Anaerolineae bacterium]|nr:hypothetical protein [Anaerolineae bacterium]
MNTPPHLIEKTSAWIDAHRDDLVRTLADLIHIPSIHRQRSPRPGLHAPAIRGDGIDH